MIKMESISLRFSVQLKWDRRSSIEWFGKEDANVETSPNAIRKRSLVLSLAPRFCQSLVAFDQANFDPD